MIIHNPILTGSFTVNGADLSTITGSVATSASFDSRTTYLESTSSALTAASASLNTKVSTIESKYASTGSNTFRAPQYVSDTTVPTGFANTSGSIYTDGGLLVNKDAYFSSSMFIKGNLTIYGTQSIAYITSSQLNIATNVITVNTATPAVRFGGLSVYDSGSTGTGATGSLFWDSQNNGWIYQHESGSTYSGGMLISGPRRALGTNLGDEQGLTACMIPVAQGGDHITSSLIYHDSTVTCIPNTLIGSVLNGTTLCVSNGIIGNNSNNLYLSSNSVVGEISFWGNQLNTRLMTINGGGCVGIGVSTPCKSLHVYSGGNEVAYFQGTTTGAWIDIKSAVSNLWSIGAQDQCSFGIYNRTATGNVLYIRNNGNVSIGTESPYSNAKFQVQVASNINFAIQQGTTDTAGLKLNVFNNVGDNNIPFEINGNTLYLKTCEVPRISISGVGQIGLFSQSPRTNSAVKALESINWVIEDNGAYGIKNNAYYNGTNNVYIGASNNTAERIYVSNGFHYYDAPLGTSGNTVNFTERFTINNGGIVTIPYQPSMLAQPGASSFSVGGSGSTAYGWCFSGCVRYNCGFTLTGATSAANNVADAGASGKIIIPATGKYLLQFSQRNEGQTTADGQFYLWINGTQRIRRHIELWNGKPYIHVDVTAILSLNTGDCLEMGAWFNTAGKTDTFQGTADTVNWMSLAKIS